MLGVFDSGLGGFFLFKALHRAFPKKPKLYLADYKHFPYGEKNSKQIGDLVRKNVDFLNSQGASQVLVACNTASACISPPYPIPVQGVIEQALKQAAKDSVNKKVGLLATKATVASKAYQKLAQKLFPDLQIYSKACPLLAGFVEEKINTNFKEDPEQLKNLLDAYLNPLLQEGVDTVILGCTHYLYLKEVIEEYMNNETKKTVSPLEFLIQEFKNSDVESSNFNPTPSGALVLDERASLFIQGGEKNVQKKFFKVWNL